MTAVDPTTVTNRDAWRILRALAWAELGRRAERVALVATRRAADLVALDTEAVAARQDQHDAPAGPVVPGARQAPDDVCSLAEAVLEDRLRHSPSVLSVVHGATALPSRCCPSCAGDVVREPLDPSWARCIEVDPRVGDVGCGWSGQAFTTDRREVQG